MNTILTVINALKLNSLTHSLQIHYTRFTSPKSHTHLELGLQERDPTIGYFRNLNEILVILKVFDYFRHFRNFTDTLAHFKA